MENRKTSWTGFEPKETMTARLQDKETRGRAQHEKYAHLLKGQLPKDMLGVTHPSVMATSLDLTAIRVLES